MEVYKQIRGVGFHEHLLCGLILLVIFRPIDPNFNVFLNVYLLSYCTIKAFNCIVAIGSCPAYIAPLFAVLHAQQPGLEDPRGGAGHAGAVPGRPPRRRRAALAARGARRRAGGGAEEHLREIRERALREFEQKWFSTRWRRFFNCF